MNRPGLKALAVLTLMSTPHWSCGWSNTAKGATIGTAGGAAAGGAIGAAIGKNAKGAAIGAIIGAAVGGTTGAVIGHHMDKRAKEIEKDLEGAKIEKVGEGILVTFSSGILFDVDSADLKSDAKNNIDKLAKVLNKYDDTDVMIVGHTDSTGNEEYNKKLSKRRAASVSTYAQAVGIDASRIKVVGEGETTPVADNETAGGRAENRRVEVAIFANDKLKDAAEKEAAKQQGG